MKLKKIVALLMTMVFILQSAVFAAEESRPFVEHTIPGIIRVADFDNGGLGIAYNRTAARTIVSYRPKENVNAGKSSEHGTMISMSGGEWIKYTANVEKTAEYELILFYALDHTSTGTFTVYEGDNVIASAAVGDTGGWSNYKELSLGRAELKQGKSVFKFELKGLSINLCYVEFKEAKKPKTDFSAKSGAYRYVSIPNEIEAEDYDINGYVSTDNKNDGQKYRLNDGIDIYEHTNGHYIKLGYGEKVTYTFNVRKDGYYRTSFKAGCVGTVDAYLDDETVPVKMTLFGNDNFDENLDDNILYLSQGTHKITLVPDVGEKNTITLDSFRLRNSDKNEVLQTDNNKENETYKNLYVSEKGDDKNDGSHTAPFRSINRAKEEISKINEKMTGDIVINIEAGYYFLDETLKLTKNESGKNGYNVIFRGIENGGEKPVISGGVEVDGWQEGENGIWSAPAPSGIKEIRNLYINDIPATRARTKYNYRYKAPYYNLGSTEPDGFTVSRKNFPEKISKPHDLEAVFELEWTAQRYPVESMFYEETSVVFMKKKENFNYNTNSNTTDMEARDLFFLENAIEFLDEPGEFYYDKDEKRIFYYPYKEENMETAKTYVGKTEFMINMVGDSDEEKITNIQFDGLTFKYGMWDDVSEKGIYAVQADSFLHHEQDETKKRRDITPSQIHIERASGIKIENCTFTCLGSAAIGMYNGVDSSVVNGNIFKDISGTGVIIGHFMHNKSAENMSKCKYIDVTNNVFRRCAYEYRNCTAISCYYEDNINICHNDIREVPYSGITVGWGWGEEVNFGHIDISYNHIQDYMCALEDGGAIYTLGDLYESRISNNYMTKNRARKKRNIIYTDSGSAYALIENNVCDVDEGGTGYIWWLVGYYHAHDMTARNNYYDSKLALSNSNKAVIYESDNVAIENKNWPDEARAIMQKAGVEPQYKKLLIGNDYPTWRDNYFDSIPDTKEFKSSLIAPIDNIEAEDFMSGGEGVAYHKINPLFNNNTYRPDDEVGLVMYGEPSNGWVVDRNFDGEWLAYEVEVSADGEYHFDMAAGQAYAADAVQPAFNLYVNDEKVFSNVQIENTINWSNYVNVNYGTIKLNRGKNIIKLEILNTGFYIDYFRIYSDEELEKERIYLQQVGMMKNDEDYDEGVIVSQ